MTNAESAPTVLWAQRTDKVMVSIQLEEVTEEKVQVEDDKFTFTGTSGGKIYELQLELNNSILPYESKQRKGGREYYMELKKKDPAYWPRLLKDTKKHQNIKVDFSRWKDEDDTDDEEVSGGGGRGGGKYDDASLEDMMKQMGQGDQGFGGADFDPGDEGSDDSDDEDVPELEAESTD